MGFPKKISQLPAAGTLKNSDIFVLVNQHDITSQTTLGTIAGMISGGSSTFTGNTLATCIDQLWVHSISGCSPIQMGEIVVNGETTFNGNVNLSPDSQTNIDFDNADTVSIPTYILKDCKGLENDIVTLQNFSEYVGQVITLASEGSTRWEVTLQPTLEVTSIEECCFDNYTLTNCVNSEVWGIVNGEGWDGSPWIGTIITMKNDFEEGCYKVTSTCNEWDKDEKINIVGEYETCAACTATTYTLFPCDGWEGLPINTDTDLSAYVGGISSIKDIDTGICYTVLECLEDCEPTIEINYEEFLDGCETCYDNWQLTNCANESIIGTTTTQGGWEPAPTVYSASTVEGCFTADKIKQAATIGEVLDIGMLEDCENWPCTNFILWSCDGDILGISSQNLTEFVDGGTYSGSNITHSFSGQCFTIESTSENAELGPLDTSDWSEVPCEVWPCTNYMISPCTEGVFGITVRQDLSDYIFDVMGTLTGTTFEESLCFDVSHTFDTPNHDPIDTSSWGSLGIEIEDCAEDPPCQPEPPGDELSLHLIQEPGTPNWTVTLTSNIGDTGVGGFQLTIGDEGILFEDGERGEIVPPSWEFNLPPGGNSNICFNLFSEEFILNEEAIIATWVLNTPDIITSLSLAVVQNGSGTPYSVGVTIG